ncbi:histidine kinase [Rhizobium leguminosarum bv. trifolii CB782]|uniref:Sensor histidine kinase n=1 Tax=Rhizobium hidalgonense TaxID=1538159 RepID=A0AAJ2GX46_9HYPH|nr:sensor histidine kinase [Rhizobium hidalgonense]AHG45031.1 histidine kinase [Rhizobium leguminosarum bv. trifolii CB782]EJC72980.1 signal transduction histidine kinase [Rhizobium leguminosarum bv. trifolii WSM2012]MDR9777500.1 sensor histidine kinase [Rhizobium hidalgonense]MDR9805126.1 sensor histidine kinase [Rhizobium hidalgonense]MDR9823812.1 sensor histidine kinase [Rhizobium hidalgonense]
MNWLRRWNARSLASQFFIAGGLISIAAMFLVGLLVTHLIEEAVIHNSGAATALYVDSVVAPLLPDMQTASFLDEGTAQALDETLGQGALGRRLVSFRLWRSDGTILYSNEKALVGRTFAVNDKLQKAFAGSLVARYEIADDPESGKERALGKPLMEIYNPVLQPWSGQAVAVIEFYESAEGLSDSLAHARLQSWAAVAALTAIFFLILAVLVFRVSRTIEAQRKDLKERVSDLSALLAENRALQRRLQRASQRVAALNETYLRSIGADLHDGPAQHIAYASLRLDSDLLINASTPPETREKELAWIRSSLAEAMTEIRSICSGLVLPQIEKSSITEIVTRVVEAHQRKTETHVETVIDDDGPEPAPAVKICIYRFVQEALNNAYRHGGGIQQTVKAVSQDGHVHVEVSDRGDGFDPIEVRPTSLGLVGLRERIDSLGGSFDVKTGEGGTTVTMTFEPMEVGD